VSACADPQRSYGGVQRDGATGSPAGWVGDPPWVCPGPAGGHLALVSETRTKRGTPKAKPLPGLPDDPEADARVKAFLAQMVRPGGALPRGVEE
jgi:hypothetical protein